MLYSGAPPGQQTERLRLSGSGYDDAVDWEFSVTGGGRAGEQATIPVPSQWEQHGFGTYNYGHDDDKAREQGHYRHRFRAPAAWLQSRAAPIPSCTTRRGTRRFRVAPVLLLGVQPFAQPFEPKCIDRLSVVH